MLVQALEWLDAQVRAVFFFVPDELLLMGLVGIVGWVWLMNLRCWLRVRRLTVAKNE